ncbi:MAG: TadE/TadG family type IV pilus assembly protein [Pirellulales bacterium]
MNRQSKRRADARRGATAAEFALTLPLFILFLMSSFEFGWLNVLRHTSDNACYEAARYAMVPGGTAAEAKAKANSLLNIIGARDAKVTVSPATLTSTTEEVTVSIDIPLGSNALVVPKFTGKKTLHSEATLKTERAQ